jgi:hypothetical protein
MKYIFAAIGKYDGADNEMLKGLLEEAGIPCMIRNENLSMAMGEIPPSESPELWILNDEDYPKAKDLIDSWLSARPEPQGPWVCPQCSETIEGQFTSCWKCGAEQQINS